MFINESEILQPQDWSFPIPITYGPGRIVEIADLCLQHGIRKPLIVTDKGSEKLPFSIKLQELLNNGKITFDVFADISPNPLDTDIAEGKKKFLDGAFDAVIAIGGGSAMDGGKAICLVANNAYDLWDFEYERKDTPEINANNQFPKLITIPTTAGTGAETESTAMITDTKKDMKFCVWHHSFKPNITILDPELALTLPRNLTAWTGFDALTHAIEAFLVPSFNPLCDAMALEALKLISRFLPVAYNEPNNISARAGMLVGSCLAGVSFLKGLGLVHSISHMIGAEYNTHHGLTNAIVLPVVLRFNLEGMDSQTATIAQNMHLEESSAAKLISEIETLMGRTDIPDNLGEIGVPLDCAHRIAKKAMVDSATSTNPKKVSLMQMEDLVKTSIIGKRTT